MNTYCADDLVDCPRRPAMPADDLKAPGRLPTRPANVGDRPGSAAANDRAPPWPTSPILCETGLRPRKINKDHCGAVKWTYLGRLFVQALRRIFCFVRSLVSMSQYYQP